MTDRTTAPLHGAITALVTPFDARGRVDREALARRARWQVERGIDGLCPCGTTGEGATLCQVDAAVLARFR